MRRLLSVLLIFVASLSVFAKGRTVQPVTSPGSEARAIPSAINGTVTALNGNMIQLAGGLVTIDATNARITGGELRAGVDILAVLAESTPGQPLRASTIVVTRAADVTLTGRVDSVDAQARTFALLGVTVHADQATIARLQPGMLVAVQANRDGNRLVAASVHVIAGFPLPERHLRGNVKSIGNDAWVITSDNQDVRVVVNAQTKILGNPQAGDPVEVIGWTDATNQFVALSIIKFERPQLIHFRGVVKSISGNTWTIDQRTVQVTSDTKLLGNPQVGDTVEVTAQGTTTLTAITIVKRPNVQVPLLQVFQGVVKSIERDTWEITGIDDDGIRKVRVAPTTIVLGNISVGDRVEVHAMDLGEGLVAMTIVRLR
ncbi:MAG TPA: DUF5666 domain-containing protein [Thermoanaerobaculia bacterium]